MSLIPLNPILHYSNIPIGVKPLSSLEGGPMTNDPKGKVAGAAGRTAEAAAQPRIVWDDVNMRSVYANATNVAGGREEIVLLFGMNQAW